MTGWDLGSEVLLAVFAIHTPFFAWRWWRTREIRYAATTLTFSLLVIAYATRVFAPQLRLGDQPLHHSLRVVALSAAVVSVALLLRRIASRLLGR
ncbi:hypothetical protein MK489_23720 [Myxococcota bacterium]|nr:hypothetical protein [Myxococcota bacterium]